MARMPGAIRTARYRARHPNRVAAYKKSKLGRAAARRGTARYRLKHPYQRKPPKPLVTAEHKAEQNRNGMRRFIAKRKGYVPIDLTTMQPEPKDSRCQKCRKIAKLHLDHDHATGAISRVAVHSM